MRSLILCLLAGASMSLAAEQPADPHASATAAEAEAPAPAATEEAATEPATADPTAAESAPTEEPAIDPAEAAKLQAEKEKAEEREFTKAGFKPRTVNGKKKYCESIGTSGSRIGKQTQCYSPEQVRAMLANEAN